MALLSEVCRQAKDEQRVTAQHLAEAADRPLGTVNKFLSGSVADTGIYTVGPVCRVLGVSLDEYFDIRPQQRAQEIAAELQELRAHAKGLERELAFTRELLAAQRETLTVRKHFIVALFALCCVLVAVLLLYVVIDLGTPRACIFVSSPVSAAVLIVVSVFSLILLAALISRIFNKKPKA